MPPAETARSLLPWLCLALLSLAACGVPGPPVPPVVKIPAAPTGLTVQQSGERVLARWTLPKLYTDGTRLPGPPRFELLRAFTSEQTLEEKDFRQQAQVVYTLPSTVVESFLHNGVVVIPDVLGAATLTREAGHYAVYGVRAVNEKGQDAGLAPLASVRVYPVPVPIARLDAHVTERAIELRWQASTETTGGTPLEAIAGYEIFRSESGAEESFALVGTSPSARYDDRDFRFGARYTYMVRTLAQFDGQTVESGNSVATEVEPRDVFPPAPPANLIAVAGPGRVDLTWDASAAPDLRGYYLYRSRTAGKGYERLTPEPLSAQSFADATAEAGVPYFYVVTAIDRTGNESAFSMEATATPLEKP